MDDPKSPMYAFSESNDIDYFMRSFKEYDNLWKKDFELYILVHPHYAPVLQRMVDAYNFTGLQHVYVHATTDPHNMRLNDFSIDFIDQWSRLVIYLGACNQQNFISAIDNFGAYFMGYANQIKSQTQVFNCHKVEKQGVGATIDLEDIHDLN